MSEYTFSKYLTGDNLKKKNNSLEKAIFSTNYPDELKGLNAENDIVKTNVFFARDLINESPSVIYPESFAAICGEFKKLGVKVDILKVKDLEKQGMNALLAVGQGSLKLPHMVVLRWNGGAKNEKPVAFVGKGVTFDSGGLSLKPGDHMSTMKCDMSGAAAVAGTIRLLAMRKAKVNAVGLCPLVENMPSGNSYRVDDIITSMSGQTIEVCNTDAEGRMILADALYYAATKFEPKVLIDLATLTGACCVALGERYSGLFTQNDTLEKELVRAGKEVNENVWRLPLSKIGGFYDNQINSNVADMRNTGKGRDGGAITAAQFLQRFTNGHGKWAHLDIAAVAFVDNEGFLTTKDATGYGVRLLNELIKINYEN
jgi:leucyl aminopeptidase